MPNAVAMANYQTNRMDKKICLQKFTKFWTKLRGV